MNKSNLIEAVHRRNDFLLKSDVQDSFNLIINFLSETLTSCDRVEIRGFGTFSVRERKERVARNPKTGSSVKVNTKFHPYFRASRNLKDILKK